MLSLSLLGLANGCASVFNEDGTPGDGSTCSVPVRDYASQFCIGTSSLPYVGITLDQKWSSSDGALAMTGDDVADELDSAPTLTLGEVTYTLKDTWTFDNTNGDGVATFANQLSIAAMAVLCEELTTVYQENTSQESDDFMPSACTSNTATPAYVWNLFGMVNGNDYDWSCQLILSCGGSGGFEQISGTDTDDVYASASGTKMSQNCPSTCSRAETQITIDWSAYQTLTHAQDSSFILQGLDDLDYGLRAYMSSENCDSCGSGATITTTVWEGMDILSNTETSGTLLRASGAGRMCLVPYNNGDQCDNLLLLETSVCDVDFKYTYFFNSFYNFTTDDSQLNSLTAYRMTFGVGSVPATEASAILVYPTEETIEVALPNLYKRQTSDDRRRAGVYVDQACEDEGYAPLCASGFPSCDAATKDTGCECDGPGGGCPYTGKVLVGNLQGYGNQVQAGMNNIETGRRSFRWRNKWTGKGDDAGKFPYPQYKVEQEIVSDFQPYKATAGNTLLTVLICLLVVTAIMLGTLIYASYSDWCGSKDDESEKDSLVEGAGGAGQAEMGETNMETQDTGNSVIEVQDGNTADPAY